MVRYRLAASLAASVSLGVIATAANAQNTPSNSAESAGAKATAGTENAGEIVVTAQRRSEKLQDVPIQVSAFSNQTLQDAGARNVQGAIALVPGMSLDRGNVYHSSYITMRGITQIENADPPVALIIDGVPQTNQRQINPNLYDVQQIEILKGPQGSLYGRNAEAGAINITTKMPTNDLGGSWNLSYSKGRTVDVSGNIFGALVKDVLLFRVGANYTRSDGLIDNTFRGDRSDFIDHDYTLNGRLIFKPTDRLTFDLRGDTSHFRAGSNYYSAVFSSNPNNFELPQNNHFGVSYGTGTNIALKADYDLDFATLSSISGYARIREGNDSDLDFRNPVDSPGGFLGTGLQIAVGQQLLAKIYSQEVRLVSKISGPVKFSVGGYFLHTDRDYRTRVYVDVNGLESQQYNPAQVLSDQFTHDNNDTYAGFGQIDYNITDKFILTGGFRYDVDSRRQDNLLDGSTRRKTYKKAQPKATLTFKPESGRLFYLTYGVGFRSGGFNTPLSAIPDFKQESLQNFEGGFKTSFAGGKLVINGAGYYENVKNYQYFFVDATAGAQVIGNIDRVHVIGAELEITATPIKDLTLNVGFGYTHTDIVRFTRSPQTVGNKTPRNVPFSSTGSLQYRGSISNNFTGLARFDYQYNNKKYWTYDNGSVQRDWVVLGARVGVETGGLGLYGFVKNLTNSKYYTEYQPQAYTGEDVDLGFRGQPRTYGVELRYNF